MLRPFRVVPRHLTLDPFEHIWVGFIRISELFVRVIDEIVGLLGKLTNPIHLTQLHLLLSFFHVVDSLFLRNNIER
jgi:hypothetical protein